MEDDPRVLLMGEDIGRLGGVFRITEHLQRDFGDRRVLDTPLAESGIVGTAMWDLIDEKLAAKHGQQRGEALAENARSIHLGRVSVPEDVAAMVSYLAGEDSDYVTGQTMLVDGGIQFS